MKKYQLPKDFAEKWIAALRSGEYPQCKQSLGNKEGYCCLGVGAIVCGATDEMLWKKNTNRPAGFLIKNDYGPNISDEVFARIPNELIGGSMLNALVHEVSVRNDGGDTFPEIADWIEQNVEFV